MSQSAAPTIGTACVAVLGTGSIGTRHLELLRGFDGVRVVAVPVRAERARELNQAGFATAGDLDDAVRAGATHCVIATDTRRHVEDGLAAIDRGLDVLVEKPMAVNAHEAQRLQERAHQAGRAVFVGCVLRFSESLNVFRELVPRLGRLHAVRIECQSYLPDWRPARAYQEAYSARAEEGGVLRDLIHDIDYAGWIYGWPHAIQASVRNLGRLGIAAEETAELLWQAPEDHTVSLSLDYLTRPHRRHMRASGEFGTLEWDGIEGTVLLSLAGDAVHVIAPPQGRDAMYAAQLKAFLDTAHGARNPRSATGADGVKALAVCDAARRASQAQRLIAVEYP